MKIIILTAVFLTMISCTSNPQYYPENMPKYKSANRYAEFVYGQTDEPPIYNYKNIRAYRILAPFSGVVIRIEKYRDNSCLAIAKWTVFSLYYSNFIDREKNIQKPIVELRVPIEQECDKFIPFDELDALYKDEQYYENKGLNWEEGTAYSDVAVIERVTEDGTFYYQSTRDKKEVEQIIETLKKIWSAFVLFDIHKAG